MSAGAFGRANAQATSGTISGVVADERQGIVANATVTARNVGTNESRTTIVDSEGRYRFPNLSLGTYEITVQANGFAKLVRSGIELLLNQDAVVNLLLKAEHGGRSRYRRRERFAAQYQQRRGEHSF